MKPSKKQMEALQQARKDHGLVWNMGLHSSTRDALIRAGLMSDRIVCVRGILGYYLTPAGEAAAAQIRKDENVVPLRRPA